MIRIGALLGMLLGVLELLGALGGPARWAGYHASGLVVVSLSGLFGAIVAASYRLLGRLRHRTGSAGSLLHATAFTGVILAMMALFAHGDGSWLPGISDRDSPVFDILVLLCGHAAFLSILRHGRRSKPLPYPARARIVARIGGALCLALILAIGLLAVRDSRLASPLGPVRVIGRSAPWPALAEDDSYRFWHSAPALGSPGQAAFRGEPDDAPRLILIGIDGATWDLVLPLVEAGKLPNLETLLADGVGGVLRSSEESASPVVWTTIMTGKSPDQHGIDSWRHATSERRRCLALWSILAERWSRQLVVNVPGTYPADSIGGVFLAGFPSRNETRSHRGYVLTTEPQEAWRVPVAPLRLSDIATGGRSAITLSDRVPGLKATAFCLNRLLPPGWPSDLFAASLQRRFLRIEMTVTEAGLRLWPNGDPGQAFDLAEQQWSPWLVIERPGKPLHFRLKLLEKSAGVISLYATPLLLLDASEAIRTTLAEQTEPLFDRSAPYVIEGAGWTIFQDPRLLPALAEQTFGAAADRGRHVIRLWRGRPWDALIYVITLTDRIMHPYWPFLARDYHARTGEPANHPAFDRPVGDVAAAFAGFENAIPQSFVWADAIVGSIVRKAAERTIVAVVSDHGFRSGRHRVVPYAGDHDPAGIYIFKGGPFTPDMGSPRGLSAGAMADDALRPRGRELDIADVTPTLLAALGLPVALDFAGSVSPDLERLLRERGLDIEFIPTYELQDADGAGPVEVDETMLEQIRSLGYVD